MQWLFKRLSKDYHQRCNKNGAGDSPMFLGTKR